MFLNIVLFLAFLLLSWKYKQKKCEVYTLSIENLRLKYKLITVKNSTLEFKTDIDNNYYTLLEKLDAVETKLEN